MAVPACRKRPFPTTTSYVRVPRSTVIERSALSISEGWCSGGDLNPHALRHTPLKRTCLPFHHPSGIRGERTSNMAPIPRKDFFLPRPSATFFRLLGELL